MFFFITTFCHNVYVIAVYDYIITFTRDVSWSIESGIYTSYFVNIDVIMFL